MKIPTCLPCIHLGLNIVGTILMIVLLCKKTHTLVSDLVVVWVEDSVMDELETCVVVAGVVVVVAGVVVVGSVVVDCVVVGGAVPTASSTSCLQDSSWSQA